MENELIKVNVENKDGKLVVSSREVAENLGKEHKNVMRDCREILEEGVEFEPSFYKTKQNKSATEYLITQDGFTLLVMNYQGYNDVKRAYIREFNKMKTQLQNQQPQLTPQEQLALQLFNGGIDAITAHKQLLELETKPLKETIQKQETKIAEDKPYVDIAKERIVKGECISLTDITKGLGLKKGQISVWAKMNGYLSKVGTEINKKGEEFFKVYLTREGFKCIGVREKGIDLINDNLEEIKNSPCRLSKK